MFEQFLQRPAVSHRTGLDILLSRSYSIEEYSHVWYGEGGTGWAIE